MAELLDNRHKTAFDEFLVAGYRDKPAELAELRWRMAPYGTDSPVIHRTEQPSRLKRPTRQPQTPN
jgi:hypothetical protein